MIEFWNGWKVLEREKDNIFCNVKSEKLNEDCKFVNCEVYNKNSWYNLQKLFKIKKN